MQGGTSARQSPSPLVVVDVWFEIMAIIWQYQCYGTMEFYFAFWFPPRLFKRTAFRLIILAVTASQSQQTSPKVRFTAFATLFRFNFPLLRCLFLVLGVHGGRGGQNETPCMFTRSVHVTGVFSLLQNILFPLNETSNIRKEKK